MANKYEIITRNLDEVIGKKKIQEIVSKRSLKLYWGSATTGKIHAGYLVPLLKIG